MSATPVVSPRVGLIFSTYEHSWNGTTPRWSDIQAMVTRAEEIGFDSVWIADHLLLQTPHGEMGWWEGGSLLAAIAAVTSTIQIGTHVTNTAFRNPALLAKMADTIDEISGGRLILGLGAGYYDREFTAFGYPIDHKVGRFTEAIQILHGLLRHGEIDFQGRYYQARECVLRPRGPRREGPPIMIGGTGPRMLQLCAQYADLWNTNLYRTQSHPEVIAPLREQVDQACHAVGRDPDTLGRTCGVLVAPSGAAAANAMYSAAITGTPDEIVATLRAFGEEGIAHLIVRADPVGLASVEACAPILERLKSMNA